MCDPVTAVAVTSMVLGGIQTISQSRQQASAMEDEAARLQQVAAVKRQQMIAAKDAGELEKRNISEGKRMALGEGRATFGATGIALGTAPVTGWEIDLESQARFDRETADYNSRIKQWQLQVEADSAMQSAYSLNKAAGQTKRTGELVGTLQIVGGAGIGAYGLATAPGTPEVGGALSGGGKAGFGLGAI